MMKMVLIVFNISIQNEVIELVKKCGVPCYTQWPRLTGEGKSTGPKLDTDVWPGANSALMIVCEENKADELMKSVQSLRDEIGAFEGIKAFQLPVEKMTGDF